MLVSTLRIWFGSLCLAGCASAPPFAPPPVPVQVAYTAAVAAAATSGESVDKPPQLDSKSVQVDVFALPTTPPLGSIEPRLAAILADHGVPFRTASSLPVGTLWASPAVGFEGGRRVGGNTAVVAAGLVTTFALSAEHLPAVGCELTVDGVQVFLRPATDEPGRERAVLQSPLTAAAGGVLFVPAASTGLAGHAIAITVTGTAGAADGEHARAVAAAAARSTPVPAPPAQQWRLAADAIGEQNRRAALLAIAAQCELAPCTDVLLAAEERQLIAIGREVAALDAAATGYGWAFQRALWTALIPDLQRDELPAGLRATVIRQLGAVTAEPSLLQLRLTTSTDAAAFTAALREENLLALADRDPVHRVRAQDWLSARGAAVPGYEPLAPMPDRTAALRARAPTEPPK